MALSQSMLCLQVLLSIKGQEAIVMKLHTQDPGGHSFGAFGTPSAVHAAGRAISIIADLETSTNPKTTFNVGVVEGGTIPTAIAEQAKLIPRYTIKW